MIAFCKYFTGGATLSCVAHRKGWQEGEMIFLCSGVLLNINGANAAEKWL